ncbi:unnamed protein product [Paramecium primaurelia]|uniref:Uncharacterized protein n=1 Tax=Paramecium primaurelia TaxID=5886 RepID=A0A8S1N8L4_PARPR|nr:unnamed protein product [Paramecium primaurelia]
MSQNDLNEKKNQLAQGLLTEIPKNTELEQFNHLSSIQETTSQNIASNYESGILGSQKLSQLNASDYIKSQNTKIQGSLLSSELSNFNYSDDENENEGKFKKTKENVIKEEQEFDEDFFEIPPDIQPVEKKFTYDELNRKCKNLEQEIKKEKEIQEKLLNQTLNDKNQINTLKVQEKNQTNLINQNAIKIQSLEEQNKQILSLLNEQKEKNLNNQMIIANQEQKLNQIQLQLDDQIKQNNQQRLQFQEQITKYQRQLKIMQIQYDKQLEIQKSDYAKQNLKQNELLKIKDQIINFLENELADLRVPNLQTKQENQNKFKLNTNPSEQETTKLNNLNQMKFKTNDQQIPKPQTQTKNFPPNDTQRLVQSLINCKPKQNNSWIKQLDEKNKNILKSYSNSQRNNQSFSNCSMTESVNQNCQTNDNQQFFIDNP